MVKRNIKIDGFKYKVTGKIIGIVSETKTHLLLSLKPSKPSRSTSSHLGGSNTKKVKLNGHKRS